MLVGVGWVDLCGYELVLVGRALRGQREVPQSVFSFFKHQCYLESYALEKGRMGISPRCKNNFKRG